MLPTHGSGLRGLNLAGGALPQAGLGRYRRMFDPSALIPRERRALDRAVLKDIADAMIKPQDADVDWTDESPTIPAGYTYFGQFVTHDLTFDPTPLAAAESDKLAHENFRTPALDLDCLYGLGPDAQPYLYTGLRVGDGRLLRLRMGRNMEAEIAPVCTRNDVFRLSDSALRFNDDRDGVAVIADPRNDQNRIVAQIHAALATFHNKVVADDELLNHFNQSIGDDRPLAPYTPASGSDSEEVRRFRTAASLVRWHYQWVVVHDFLDRICAPGVKDRVLNAGGEPLLRCYRQQYQAAYMPLEFAGAVFRFGHSMVRDSYALNKYIGSISDRLPIFSPSSNSLSGFSGELPAFWNIDWGYFLCGLPHEGQPEFDLPQRAFRIDAILSEPLKKLPEFSAQGEYNASLAFRNLDRGEQLALPSGQQIAQALAELRIDPALNVAPISDDDLWDIGNAKRDALRFDNAKQESAFNDIRARRRAVKEKWVDGDGVLKGNTPLWYVHPSRGGVLRPRQAPE